VYTQQTNTYSNQTWSHISSGYDNQICPHVTGLNAKAKMLVADKMVNWCTLGLHYKHLHLLPTYNQCKIKHKQTEYGQTQIW